jgi:hypothetical protein
VSAPDDDEERDMDPKKPRPGCFLLVIPIVMVMGIVVAYLVMFVLGMRGRAPQGDEVRVAFRGCPEAAAIVTRRIDLMGLGEPRLEATTDGFAFTAKMPADPGVAARIPATLATTGHFAIVADDGTLVVDGHVDGSTVHVGTGQPETLVRLDDDGSRVLREHMIAHPDGRVRYDLDAETIGERSNMPAEARGNLEIVASGLGEKEQLEVAAARSVVLDTGPLPCPVELIGTTVVTPAGSP